MPNSSISKPAFLLFFATLVVPSFAQSDPPCSIGATLTYGYGSMTKLGIPYSLTVKSTFEQKLPDGNSIHGFIKVHDARSNAGLMRSETGQHCYLDENGQPTLSYSVMIQDVQTKTNTSWQVNDNVFALNEKVVRVNHWQLAKPLTPEEQAKRNADMERQRKLQPPPSQFKREDLGVKTMHGVTVHGSRMTRTIPANYEGNELPLEVINEDWQSRELGITMLAISDDPRRGKNTFEVVDISLTEPDPSLFTAPAGYVIKENPPQP